MVGLRTQENSKFLEFWKIVQGSANSLGKTFFLDCGEGNEYEDNCIECENLSGWLIANDAVNKFKKIFNSKEPIGEEWEDSVAFVSWEKVNGKIKVKFE